MNEKAEIDVYEDGTETGSFVYEVWFEGGLVESNCGFSEGHEAEQAVKDWCKRAAAALAEAAK